MNDLIEEAARMALAIGDETTTIYFVSALVPLDRQYEFAARLRTRGETDQYYVDIYPVLKDRPESPWWSKTESSQVAARSIHSVG
ncbi:MAG: hypothetical protein AAGI44_00045 [Pseudomonadota bacterium]